MGIIERKEREKQQRRKDIINAAERIFFTKGFDKATMDDVAEEAELSKGTLYLYFQSKEDLHLAVAIKAIELMNSMTGDLKSFKMNGLDKLVRLGRIFIEFSRNYPDHMRSILSLEGMDLGRFSMSIKEFSQVIYEASPVKLVMEFVKQGIDEDLIRNDIPQRVIAHTLWMQMLGVIQIVSLKKNLFEMIDMTPDALFENHIELVLHGIKK